MHLLVCLSSHGFGHAAQTAPVVNALRVRMPGIRITLRTGLPASLLANLFEGPFEHIAEQSDFGMVMASALDVRLEESAVAYAQFHDRWDEQVVREAAMLVDLAPNVLLANVPYLPLAGAARAGIPAAAMCSLNWADIYRHYCRQRTESDRIHAQMLAAYRSAAVFLQTQPSMPMADLPNRRAIGPVARVGANRRLEVRRALGISDEQLLINVAPGGIAMRLPFESWPRRPDVHYLVPAIWEVRRDDVTDFETLGMSFPDALRACDVLLGKPGYGSFTEAACNGVPVLYVRRHDWPEEPYLIEWLERLGRCLEIERGHLESGFLTDALTKLQSLPTRAPVTPAGIDQAVDHLIALWRT
jgi:hypothetical protein